MDARKERLERRAARQRIREQHGLGMRKNGSAKAQNMRDRPDRVASGICLVCGLNRLKCICSGYMSEAAFKRFQEGQKQRPTPKQSGF